MSGVNLTEFVVLCESNHIEVPEPVTRGIELMRVANEMRAVPQPSTLGMTDAEAREHVVDLAIRKHRSTQGLFSGYETGIADFQERVWGEVRAAMLPALDDIVTRLQPQFDEIVAPIVAGVEQYGFTYRTSSDALVVAGDMDAVQAWREVGQAWSKVRPIARLRVRISELFRISPTEREAAAFGVSALKNWSVCFAAGNQWAFDERGHVEGRPSLTGLDWLALARGGLRLNTPSEVREKLVERAKKEGVTLSTPPATVELDEFAQLPSYGKTLTLS